MVTEGYTGKKHSKGTKALRKTLLHLRVIIVLMASMASILSSCSSNARLEAKTEKAPEIRADSGFILTTDEQAYLNTLRNQPITIAYSYDLVVAEFEGESYSMIDPILDVLKNKFGLTVELVKSNWHDAFVQVENSDVDFYGPIAISETRRQKYITVDPFYRSYSKIMTRVSEPVSSMVGLYNRSIGLLEGSVISRTMHVYLGPEGKTIYFPSMEAMIEGLQSGLIDAFATVDNAEFEILRNDDIRFEFSIENFYVDQGFISGKEEMRPLAALINRYLSENAEILDRVTDLRNEALTQYTKTRFAEEIKYLQANYDKIPMFTEAILYPLCYEENGVIKGMQPDINDVFTALTGIPIIFISTNDFLDGLESATDLLETGESLANVGVYYNIDMWKNPLFAYSPLLWMDTLRTYSRYDSISGLAGKKLGTTPLATDYLGWNNTTGNIPTIDASRKRLLDYLKGGELDAVFIGEMVFNYEYTIRKDYSLREVSGLTAEAAMHMLYGAQNKEFNTLFNESMNLYHLLKPRALGEWKTQNDKYKSDYIRMRYTQQIMTMIIIVVFIVMLLTLLFMFLRNKQAHKRTRDVLMDVEEKRRIIMDGIDYASKIQKNLLPINNTLKNAFLDYSVIWEPRDIVGGDIYWMKQFETGTVLVVADCTGHGTPGALLTMLVVSALENAVLLSNCHDTAEIIWGLEQRFVEVFSVKSSGRATIRNDIKDGCDLAVLFIANDGNISLSAGHTNVYVCDGKEIKRIKGQRLYVGEGKIRGKDKIKTVHIPYNPENKFYIASDGLSDQLGWEEDLPFGYCLLGEIALANHNKPLSEITDIVWAAFEKHRGTTPRVDDFELVAFKPRGLI